MGTRTASDYSIWLADASRSGLRRLDRNTLDALIKGAGEAGCLVQRVNLKHLRDKAELLLEFGKSLRFPEWFGQNWDGLSDCLRDMGWRPAVGYVTLLEHCDGFRERAGAEFDTLIEILEIVADDWRAQGIPFWCLVELQPNPFDGV